MIKITQEILHDPGNGIKGNCFSASIASLLHLDQKDIPVFDNDSDIKDGSWLRNTNKFLKKYGMMFLVMDYTSFKDIYNFCQVDGLYCELSGDSPRFNGVGHSCIGFNLEVIHDPHPSRAGIIPEYVGLFIPLEPWKFIEKSQEKINEN